MWLHGMETRKNLFGNTRGLVESYGTVFFDSHWITSTAQEKEYTGLKIKREGTYTSG